MMALIATLLVGCQSTVPVPIRVRVASTVDTQRYARFVVIPFVDKDDRLPEAQLERLAELVRERLDRTPGVTVVGASYTRDMMIGEDVTEATTNDPDSIRAWGDMFEADAVIAANLRYYTLLQSAQRRVERYSYSLQRYVTDYESALMRSHYLSLDMRVYDAKSGEMLLGRKKSARYNEPHNVLSAVVSEVSASTEIALQLAQRPIREFVRLITPHYDFEERLLKR